MPEAVAAARPRRWEGWDRAAPIWVLATAALVGLILLPLGWLAYMSVRSDAGFTLAHYARVLGDPPLQKALWNTVVLAFWSGLRRPRDRRADGLAHRAHRPAVARAASSSLVMASFVTPPFLGAFAWVMLAGPNAGYLNRLYRELDRRRRSAAQHLHACRG